MSIVEGYFDESGDLDQSPGIFCVSGYFISTDRARLMHADWVTVLQKYQLGFFHMVDCAHGNDGFEHLTKNERTAVVTELIGLIKQYTLEGFSIFAQADGYQRSDDAPDVYSECAASCISALQMFLKMSRSKGKILYFFENGHKDKGSAYNHIARKLRDTDNVTFASKAKVPLLQAADLLAWQSAKYAKDWRYPMLRGQSPRRAPRKDFQSLMEHPHAFLYMDKKNEHRYLGIEIWPLNQRSQFSVDMSIDYDGPIVYLREAGSKTPIVPIGKTVGFRIGGARMAYVAFNDMKDNEFALAFDEPRLFEAAITILESTGIYENSRIVPMFSADDASIDCINGLPVMHIKIRKGATIAFHLPDDVAARLKKSIDQK